MSVYSESPEERRARYTRLAIAAAAAAARAPLPEVRTAYLLLAESWSNLAKTDEPPREVVWDATKAPEGLPTDPPFWPGLGRTER